MINRKKIFLITISIIILITIVYVLYLNNIFIITEYEIKCTEKNIGIIDTYLTNEYDNLIYEKYTNNNISNDMTHGDSIVQFIKDINYTGNIYYYSAWNGEKITADALIEGLEWMKKNGIKKVNISLSSSKFSKNLKNWIITNKDVLRVYASYNNNLNTVADYPAMYDYVLASGCDSRIPYKDNDIKYRSNKIIILSRMKLKFYQGNSYLSPLSMIRK